MQERPLHIKGQFLEDSAKIGQPIHYSLQVIHPKDQELFFPSIQRQYGVFEPVKKEYFKTKSTAEGNLDSAVYTFRFFDIAKPYPISIADARVHGGLGIMLDDILAGFVAAGALLAVAYCIN